MAKHDNAQWVEIDLETLAEDQRQAYEDYKTAQRAAAKLRAEFEGTMQWDVPEGQRMVFGYRFGKLSAALVKDDRKVAKPKVAAKSLTDWLAEAAQR